MALVECGVCGKLTGKGAFCGKCGAELSESALSPQGEETVENLVSPPAREPDSPEAKKKPLAEGLLRKAVSSLKRSVGSSSSLMHVEHDQSRVFVVGQTMNFRFALTPQVDGLSDVFVAVVFEGRSRKVEVKRLGWIPCSGERRELRNINFAAPEAGSLGFSFYFGFKRDDQEIVFEADSEHKVWPSHARATDVVRNVEINIQNSGHATDFNLAGLKNQLSPGEKLEDVIDRLHRMQPVWSELRLYRSTWRPPRVRRSHEAKPLVPVSLNGIAPRNARVRKLTLKTDGRVIHLITGDTLHIGKNRQNDVVTRLFENGKATGPLNARISRYHCVIERQGKQGYLIDRSDVPGERSRPSPNGIFVDSQRVSPRGRHELDLQKACRLTLAGAESESAGVFGFELEPWSCDPAMYRACKRDCGKRKLASLVMRRCDGIPETYIALWECFILGEADPDFDGLIVWREGAGYGYATAEAEGWLEPGMSVQTPQCEVRVEAWCPLGV